MNRPRLKARDPRPRSPASAVPDDRRARSRQGRRGAGPQRRPGTGKESASPPASPTETSDPPVADRRRARRPRRRCPPRGRPPRPPAGLQRQATRGRETARNDRRWQGRTPSRLVDPPPDRKARAKNEDRPLRDAPPRPIGRTKQAPRIRPPTTTARPIWTTPTAEARAARGRGQPRDATRRADRRQDRGPARGQSGPEAPPPPVAAMPPLSPAPPASGGDQGPLGRRAGGPRAHEGGFAIPSAGLVRTARIGDRRRPPASPRRLAAAPANRPAVRPGRGRRGRDAPRRPARRELLDDLAISLRQRPILQGPLVRESRPREDARGPLRRHRHPHPGRRGPQSRDDRRTEDGEGQSATHGRRTGTARDRLGTAGPRGRPSRAIPRPPSPSTSTSRARKPCRRRPARAKRRGDVATADLRRPEPKRDPAQHRASSSANPTARTRSRP